MGQSNSKYSWDVSTVDKFQQKRSKFHPLIFHFFLSITFLIQDPPPPGLPKNTEKDFQPPCNKVASTLLEDVRIHQYYDCHHLGAGHTPVHQRVQGAGTSYQRATSAVGECRQPKPLPIGAPGKTTSKQKNHPESPHIEVGADGLSQINLQTMSPINQPVERTWPNWEQDKPPTAGREVQGSPDLLRRYRK